MDNKWDEELDKLDWDAIIKESELTDEEKKKIDLEQYLGRDDFDYKRSYIRKFTKAHPEILDRDTIARATELMQEAHEGGEELDADDALRFVRYKRQRKVSELVKMLTDVGATDDNIVDTILDFDDKDDGKFGTVKNAAAKKKAYWLTRWTDMLAKNPDVLILGVPVFDPQSDWAQAKVAFFSENLSAVDKNCLNMMIRNCDSFRLIDDQDVAITVFQIYNIWDDFG